VRWFVTAICSYEQVHKRFEQTSILYLGILSNERTLDCAENINETNGIVCLQLHDMKYFKVAEHEIDLYRMYSRSIIKFPIFKWFYIPAVTMIPSLIPISNVLTPFQTPTRFSGYIRFSKRRLQYLDRWQDPI